MNGVGDILGHLLGLHRIIVKNICFKMFIKAIAYVAEQLQIQRRFVINCRAVCIIYDDINAAV